jgi:hypothetical protein
LSLGNPREYRWTVFSVRVWGVDGGEALRAERIDEEAVEEEVCEWDTSCIRCAVDV